MMISNYTQDLTSAYDVESALDVVGRGFLTFEGKKTNDLTTMLENSKVSIKLEAMKHIIGMIAKGQNASSLFPAVVKNVVSKNFEVKKLVYVYLMRYAEEQQDLALLSISSFQRSLKDSNQLIRGSALRVLSSIRVSVIVPILMLAIRDAVNDMSPYVRKATAHAIVKLYNLAADQKDELIELIEKLLLDKSTLVIGSAVMAFEEVCPDRIDLIHKNFRKLCNLLIDVEEWGQVIILNMLTRYARTQFSDPNLKSYNTKTGLLCEEDEFTNKSSLDPDFVLLINSARHLLYSRNASVILAVAQLYHHLAPHDEFFHVVRPLLRLLRSHTEIQILVLHCIASLLPLRKKVFEPHLRNFFLNMNESTRVKLMKLNILAMLTTSVNISKVLCELQTYVMSSDTQLVTSAIQAIGYCGKNMPEVADVCLNGLVTLLSRHNETVVAESIIVIRRLLQSRAEQHINIIIQLSQSVDTLTSSKAKASILWLVGEYCELVPKIGPDVLRKVLRNFGNECTVVKLQILTLAVKLYLTNSKQCSLLTQYVFNLCKYDQDYDIRDRARFLKYLIFPLEGAKLNLYAKQILLSLKPSSVFEFSKCQKSFILGSLSQYLQFPVTNYIDLPPFPETASGPSVRNVDTSVSWNITNEIKIVNNNEDLSETSEFEEDEETSTEESSEENSQEEKSDTELDEESSNSLLQKSSKYLTVTSETPSQMSETHLEFLLDLNEVSSVHNAPVLTPLVNGTNKLETNSNCYNNYRLDIEIVSAPYIPKFSQELLSKNAGYGLHVKYHYSRVPFLYSSRMITVELYFYNQSDKIIKCIGMDNQNLPYGITLHKFSSFSSLSPDTCVTALLGVDTNDSTSPITFNIIADSRNHNVTLKVPIGEMIRPIKMSYSTFLHYEEQLKGLSEQVAAITLHKKPVLPQIIYEKVNMLILADVEGEDQYCFSGQTVSHQCLILLTVKLNGNEMSIKINCSNIIISTILLKEIKEYLLSL